MYLSTARPGVTSVRFWLARAIRIVPLYYLSTLLFMVLVALAGEWPAAFSPLELLKSALFIPYDNSLNGQSVPILGVGWTLNYEALFYLVFGLALFLPSRRLQIGAIAAVLIGLVICRFALQPTGPVGTRFTSPLFMEFLAGIALAVIWQNRSTPSNPKIGLTLIVVGMAGLALVSTLAHEMPRTLGYGIPSVILLQGFILSESIFRQPRFAPLRFLGDASYAIYLTHGIVIYAAARFVAPAIEVSVVAPLVLTLVALAIGVTCYLYVDKPLLDSARTWIRRPNPAPSQHPQAHA